MVTDDTLINLDKLDRIVSIDVEHQRVTVQAGIRLKELNQILPKHGLAMRNLGSIGEQSIADALEHGGRPVLDIVRLRFGLHRAINDALADIKLLPLGPLGRQVYVDATITVGEQKAKRSTGRIDRLSPLVPAA